MFKKVLIGLSLMGSLLCALGHRAPLYANVIRPASAQEILQALGPDAKGLELEQENLPDLFALTASRLEEDSKTFLVQESYRSGRWAGGKVTIEYARDLSYTIVSVYDKKGKRQRIYSVTAKAEEVVTARPPSRTSVDEEKEPVHVVEVPAVPEGEPTPPRTPSASSSPSEEDEVPPTVYEVKAIPSEPQTMPSSSKRKNDETVPRTVYEVKPSAPPPPVRTDSTAPKRVFEVVTVPMPERPHGKKHTKTRKSKPVAVEKGEQTVSAPTPVKEPPPPPPTPKTPPITESVPAPKETIATVPSKSRQNKKRSIEVASKPVPTPAAEVEATPVAYEWDDEKNAYVPVRGSIAEAAPVQPVVETPAAPARVESVKKSKPAVAATPSVASQTNGYEWDEEKNAYVPIRKSAESSDMKVASVPDSYGSSEETPNQRRRREKPMEMTSVPIHPSAYQTPPLPETGPGAAAAPMSESVPTTEELLGAPEKPSTRKVEAVRKSETAKAQETRPAVVKQEAPPPPPPPVEAPKPITAKATTPPVKTEDPALAAAKAKYQAPPPPPPEVSPVTTSSRGPDTSDGDKWVPKETPKAAPEPEPAPAAEVATTEVAMVPKPVDNSIDAILNAASEGKAQVPNEGDAWVPKKNATARVDAQLEAELAKARAQKKTAAAQPIVRRDVNNPEAGVLPVSQFEKFSGPHYGRHREYERRFFPGKRSKAPIQDYDFYVDEVDRKKETHNVYYYKKGANNVPRLVAVEHHEKVTFLSNYDVDKEDKGKVSTY